jgi:hypothetical protein
VLRLSRDTALTGWVWATAAQVVALMGEYEPAVLTANPPSVSGPQYFLSAGGVPRPDAVDGFLRDHV